MAAAMKGNWFLLGIVLSNVLCILVAREALTRLLEYERLEADEADRRDEQARADAAEVESWGES